MPHKIILFGSFTKERITPNTDLDVLVVTGDDIENPRKENVRIRPALRGISTSMDIVVVRKSQWMDLKDSPGRIYREAWREGKVRL